MNVIMLSSLGFTLQTNDIKTYMSPDTMFFIRCFYTGC